MQDLRVPLSDPQPNVLRFIRCMLGQEVCERPPLVEYLVDSVVMRPIVTQLLGCPWTMPQAGDRGSQSAYWDNFIEFWYRMGYDFVRMELSLPFQVNRISIQDAAPQSKGDRAWADEHQGTIMSWQDFEEYDWPNVAQADFFPYEYVNAHLPDGMGLIASHAGGLFEHLSMIMSYEGLCWALHDQPDLVEAIAERLGALMEAYYRRLLTLARLVALFPGDDMGFRTGTLLSPGHLRAYVLPWHGRFAELAHQRGLPYFLHSCGNLEVIMTDLIDDVGIDGKHSFENAILPVPEFQRRYGDRIAVLGGVDVHVLASSDPSAVRRHVRDIIDACAPSGRFAIGSGNSIPSYVPVENYLAMVDEAVC
jgi:uroporphyrinogen decarboxylase